MDFTRSGWRALLSFSLISWMAWGSGLIPVSGLLAGLPVGVSPVGARAAGASRAQSLEAFSRSLPAGTSDRVAGVYVRSKLALRVLEQPSGQPGYVTGQAEAVSHFGLAQKYGTVGLIAHNTLAGSEFFQLREGDRIVLLRENGRRQAFTVTAIRRLQALSPWSPLSSFRDLADPGSTLSAQSLFNQVYAGAHSLVLQTCITANGDPSWGRLFVLAEPALDRMQAARIDRLARLLVEPG